MPATLAAQHLAGKAFCAAAWSVLRPRNAAQSGSAAKIITGARGGFCRERSVGNCRHPAVLADIAL
jgi:hypothetical protein